MVQMQQNFHASCAATSLLCAAVELGVKTLPKKQNLTMWVQDYNNLELSDYCQRRIYQWTSHEFQAPMFEAAYWGYSMPTDVADCALHLGLQAEILVYRSWTAFGLKLTYRDEWARILNHPCYTPMRDTHSRDRTLLQDNERELKVLAEWQDFVGPIKRTGSLHVVMARPRIGAWAIMEPGQGMNMESLKDVKEELDMHGTGLSVIVRKP